MPRRAVLALIIALALIGWQLHATAPPSLRAELPTRSPDGARLDRLIIEPDAGLGPIDALLASPRRTLDLELYELVDPQAEAILAADAARGVRVRVILDHRLEARHNEPAYDYLRAQGVAVSWAAPRYAATHEKTFVIDGRTSVVMSLNLAAQYYATSRDVAVVDHDPADAAAIESVFDADFAAEPVGTPPGDDLVWSPGQSQADLLALIAGARSSVELESEELTSPAVITALVAAAHRGVAVRVAMTYDAAAVPGLDAVVAAGGEVSLMHGETPLYIHAKLLVADAGDRGERAFVGSENLSDASLLHDRELGVVLLSPRLVGQVAATIAGDLTAGQPWR